MKKLQLTVVTILFLGGLSVGRDLYNSGQPRWKAQQDYVYLQERSDKIRTDNPVTSVAVSGEHIFGVMNGELYELKGTQLIHSNDSPAGISRLKQAGNQLWALASTGLYTYRGNNWFRTDSRVFTDICMHLGKVHASTLGDVFRLEDEHLVNIKPAGGYYTSDVTMLQEDGSQINDTPVEIGPIQRIASHNGTLYILRPGELVLFDGQMVNRDFVDWGRLPSRQTHDILPAGSRVLVATDKGLGVLRGASLRILKGTDGLPVEQTTCLAAGFDNDTWIGTPRGAVRMLSETEWQYFGATNWLPDGHVNDIAVSANKVLVATDKGIGIISYEPFTLLKKADYYERHLEEWGHKRLGFIHNLYLKNGEWIREVSDNDGGHTAPYLAAMCYKYACTGDATARKEAVESFKALVWLNRVTEHGGYIARSIWSAVADKDERGKQGSGGLPAKWYPTKDGKWFWKGDTSSDEVTAHFFAISLFYELVAEGKEKEIAREHIRRMASYIIDCGWVMNDLDGKPTRWARWNPEYLLRPYGYSDKGLNGLEALSFMETAYAITGDEKFKTGNQQLVKWDYPANTVRQKNVFPPETIAPWDDHLAFWSYCTLLRYVKDPVLKATYLRSLERTWEVKRMAIVPWFNFAYGAITGNDCDEAASVMRLREVPLSCLVESYTHSDRDDLFTGKEYTSYEGAVKSLSPRETSINQENHSSSDLDGRSDGKRVSNPSGYLLNYWMGRFHGIIGPPASSDPAMLKVERTPGRHLGAAPYDGPPRPEL